jgi:mannose-6-phosphate isomerase-like protein (cupin superfamily)
VRVEKPWGYETELHATDRYSLWELHILPGQETSLHRHDLKDVFLVVQGGELIVESLNNSRTLAQGSTALINRGEYHRLKAPKGAVVIEVEWPNNREDITRKEDKYGRV